MACAESKEKPLVTTLLKGDGDRRLKKNGGKYGRNRRKQKRIKKAFPIVDTTFSIRLSTAVL